MFLTRGQLSRWPRRRVSRAKQRLAGTRRAEMSNTRVKSAPLSSSRGVRRLGGEGGWPLWREGP